MIYGYLETKIKKVETLLSNEEICANPIKQCPWPYVYLLLIISVLASEIYQ